MVIQEEVTVVYTAPYANDGKAANLRCIRMSD